VISVLVYSQSRGDMAERIVEQLDLLGYHAESSQQINIPRLVLNSYQIIHLIVQNLPLSLNEIICITAAKALGKAVVLSLMDTPNSSQIKNLTWLNPDAITVSQTNFLKFFRNKAIPKMILPELFSPSLKKHPAHSEDQPLEGFVFPLQSSLHEAIGICTEKPVYCDGRKLLEKKTSSTLRKDWTLMIQQKKISSNFQLILSEGSLNTLFARTKLALIVASSEMKNSDFEKWLRLSLDYRHILILNQFQATGFSGHWTSGQNCLVISAHDWLKDLNSKLETVDFSKISSAQEINQKSLDLLFNDLSRLYTKIIYQKTSLLDSGSAKI